MKSNKVATLINAIENLANVGKKYMLFIKSIEH